MIARDESDDLLRSCFLCGAVEVEFRPHYVGITGGGNLPWRCKDAQACIDRRKAAIKAMPKIPKSPAMDAYMEAIEP